MRCLSVVEVGAMKLIKLACLLVMLLKSQLMWKELEPVPI